jgi:hypothetical protein
MAASPTVYPIFIKVSILAGDPPDGLYLLEDSTGRVEFDVPVKGATTATHSSPEMMRACADALRALAGIFEKQAREGEKDEPQYGR